MKKELTAAAVAAALVFAGCGGGGEESNQALSYDDFGQAVSDVCGAAGAEVNAAYAGLQESTAAVNDLIPVYEGVSEDIAALDPPAELEQAFEDHNAARETELGFYEEAQQADEAGDDKAALTALLKGRAAKPDVYATASKLGATSCVPGAS